MKEKGRKILVIEDEQGIRQTTREILELEGYQVLTAENGKQGLQLAQTEIPDLVLCDIRMPQLNGHQVLQALRENKALQMIPFIFLTAKADRDDLRQGMDLGADDYLTKPFDIEELLNAVASRLERQAIYHDRIQQEHTKRKALEKVTQQIREQMAQSQKNAEIKGELLDKVIADFSNPVSNINVALQMLKGSNTNEQRDRYLHILQEECQREMQLLNEITELQTLLTPEKTAILQKYNLLNR
jgi:two-component system alkaline phosphatase synthesis response regulator PhoP